MRVGHTGMTPKQVADNIVSVVYHAVSKIPGGIANVQTIYIRGNETVAIPLYQAVPSKNDEINLSSLIVESQPRKRAKLGPHARVAVPARRGSQSDEAGKSIKRSSKQGLRNDSQLSSLSNKKENKNKGMNKDTRRKEQQPGGKNSRRKALQKEKKVTSRLPNTKPTETSKETAPKTSSSPHTQKHTKKQSKGKGSSEMTKNAAKPLNEKAISKDTKQKTRGNLTKKKQFSSTTSSMSNKNGRKVKTSIA